MISSKIILLSILFILPIIAKQQWKCEPVICPPCEWNLDDTFEQALAKYFSEALKTPEDGSCLEGVKLVARGADFGFSRNACCCVPASVAAESPCTDTNNVQCPADLIPDVTETVEKFYTRVVRKLKNAPSDGCCPPGSFKWTYLKEDIGLENNICACTPRIFIQTQGRSFSESSSESE